MPIIFICQSCGKTFIDYPSTNRKYCSKACTDKAKRKTPNIKLRKRVKCICTTCGKEFEVPRYLKQSRKYCSLKCKNPGPVTLICQYCGKKYQVTRARAGKSYYCSKVCHYAARRGKPKPDYQQRITLICQICSKPYQVHLYRVKNSKYCSEFCRRKGIITKEERECVVCGKRFKRHLAALKRRAGLYCSQACYFAGCMMPNTLERLVNSLTPTNVTFVGDGKFWVTFNNGTRKCPDFKIVRKRKVIEVHGNYWHAGENEQELIDLYAEVGYECLVLWESDIRNKLDDTLNRIAIFIGEPNWQLSLPL